MSKFDEHNAQIQPWKDDCPAEDQQQAKELAHRLSSLIEDANSRVIPLCEQIRKHTEHIEENRKDGELVAQVKALIEQAEKTLDETNGAIKSADPNNSIAIKIKQNLADHTATPEEQCLAVALKMMVKEDVHGTIERARHKLDSLPKVKKDPGLSGCRMPNL